jgi:hypothetical protein
MNLIILAALTELGLNSSKFHGVFPKLFLNVFNTKVLKMVEQKIAIVKISQHKLGVKLSMLNI